MLATYTELKHAQKVKEYLLKHKLLHPDYLPVKELGYIYFAINKKAKIPSAETVNTKFDLPLKNKPITIEELLKDKLTSKELELIPKSQEIVGKILILEIPPELKTKERVIAEAYLKSNKNIETVVRKNEIHTGIFRLRTVRILAGKNTKETIHFENGVKLKLDLEKTYFSARSSNERLRIAKQIKKPEFVLIMFSGAAPYPLVIAKNSPAKIIYGVEINPLAHKYASDNVALNKQENKIRLIQGDVTLILPKLELKFDRIAMPLPKTGEEFLPLALTKAKKGAVIHYYTFISEAQIPEEAKKIRTICKNNKHQVKVLRAVKCGQFSPHVFRICFDLKIIK